MPEFTDTFPFVNGVGVGTINDIDSAYPANPDTPAANQPQKRIQLASPVAGTYIVTVSSTWVLPEQNKKGRLRFTTDGTTWEEASKEIKDLTDVNFADYSFPMTLDGSAIDYIVQAATDPTAAQAMDVHFLNLFINRVA